MNEIFDKLILRVFFGALILLFFFLFKHAYVFFYPTTRVQMFKRFYPDRNAADTVHLFGKVIGLTLVFSQATISVEQGLLLAGIDFSMRSCFSFILFLASLYIMDSIVLYNFEYQREVTKRKNMAFSICSAGNALAVGVLLRAVVSLSLGPLIHLVFLWPFAMVLLGLATKTYPLFGKQKLNPAINQMQLGPALSYFGFILGLSILVSVGLDVPYGPGEDLSDVKWYIIGAILKILLCLLLFPLLQKGLEYNFRVQTSAKGTDSDQSDPNALGQGVYEGIIFLSTAVLTSIIVGRINFGSFYPLLD